MSAVRVLLAVAAALAVAHASGCVSGHSKRVCQVERFLGSVATTDDVTALGPQLATCDRSQAVVSAPVDVAVSLDGATVFVVDSGNNVVRAVNAVSGVSAAAASTSCVTPVVTACDLNVVQA
jgi:DNA-binding beta-propeller fold protein YncE